MQSREKYLALVLLTSVMLWQAGPIFHGWFIQPINERQDRLTILKRRLDKNEDFELELIRAKSAVMQAERQSLPPNPLDAQRLYQSWLTDIALMSELKIGQVRPSRRSAQGDFYTAVQVELVAEGTYEQLTRFLFSFYRADLLHNLVRLNVESTASQGDPLLNISLTAEGLSLRNSVARNSLFSETKLVAEMDDKITELIVADNKGFPKKAPFLIRIGSEYLQVINILDDHRWQVLRGREPTRAQAHAVNSEVQLAPLNKQYASQSWSDFQQHLAANNFIIPLPPKIYTPRIKTITDQKISRGDTFNVSASVEDWDPMWGKPEFQLEQSASIPDGLKIDSDSGLIAWEIPKDYKPQTIPITVTAQATKHSDKQVQTKFQITVLKPNMAPQVEAIADQDLFIGQSWLFAIEATDEEKHNLSFALVGSGPEGLEIDKLTGIVAWSPPQSMKPGTYPVKIVVTDDGQPAAQTNVEFRINLQEDAAQFTFLVACVSADNDRFAWLYNRANNEKTILRAESLFKISNISAMVVRIEDDHLLFQVDKHNYRINTGENLRTVMRDGPMKPESRNSE